LSAPFVSAERPLAEGNQDRARRSDREDDGRNGDGRARMTRQHVRRKSCMSCVLKLWTGSEHNYISIDRPGRNWQRVEVQPEHLADVETKFDAISTADQFAEFVNEMAAGVKA
jgi:hypothetical protein